MDCLARFAAHRIHCRIHMSKRAMMVPMRKHALLYVTIGLLGCAALARSVEAERAGAVLPMAPPVSCAELATDPANGLAGNATIKSATSRIVPANGANASYCQVDLVYSSNPDQTINIRVGLPLNSKDGGTG